MGWLDKKKQPAAGEVAKKVEVPVKAKQAATQSGSTIIGPGLTIEGKLRTEREEIWIAGRILGDLESDGRVTIADSGLIEGSVHCKTVIIHGEVKGNVVADESITIEATGRLIGDITSKQFINQPGGFFQGYSKMLEEGSTKAKGDAGKGKKENKEGQKS